MNFARILVYYRPDIQNFVEIDVVWGMKHASIRLIVEHPLNGQTSCMFREDSVPETNHYSRHLAVKLRRWYVKL
jgi:hypothetical protein